MIQKKAYGCPQVATPSQSFCVITGDAWPSNWAAFPFSPVSAAKVVAKVCLSTVEGPAIQRLISFAMRWAERIRFHAAIVAPGSSDGFFLKRCLIRWSDRVGALLNFLRRRGPVPMFDDNPLSLSLQIESSFLLGCKTMCLPLRLARAITLEKSIPFLHPAVGRKWRPDRVRRSAFSLNKPRRRRPCVRGAR